MSKSELDRRSFLVGSAAALGAGAFRPSTAPGAPAIHMRRPHPVVISSVNGFKQCLDEAMQRILNGQPLVEALVAGVTHVENDPTDHSVGLGGLPNEEGVVQLDASVMDGLTCDSGAVGALENIKNAAMVALHVMRYTDHCLLAGEGALRFAKAQGFKEENLLTDSAREMWLAWKASLSPDDDWFPKPRGMHEKVQKILKTTGTINCDGLDKEGNLAGVTTTSGLSYKIPGRVGDSPIIGAGLYVDNRVGAAGSTGRGEANIITCGSATVVEGMRQGKHPTDACLYGCQRIVDMTVLQRLLRKPGHPNFNVKFYAVDKQGRHGGAAIYPGGSYAVFDGLGKRLMPLAGLLKS